MSSNKRETIKPNSKLGKIIFNYQPRDQHSQDLPNGTCEYIYGDPLEAHHYCGKPISARRYCAEHHAVCYSTRRKTRLTAV